MYSFRHEAMATDLTLSFGGVDEAYASGAAQAFFARVDEIEAKLSLYQETSDVTRINLLGKGEQTRVSEECIECLQIAMLASEMTGGLFHPFLGGDSLKAKGEAPSYLYSVLCAEEGGAKAAAVQIDPAARQVFKVAEGVVLDFGGIGKGFALDLAMEEIEDWEVPVVVANFGGSTLLFRSAGSAESWNARLAGDRLEPFSSGAFSSSGVGFQGEHIVSSEGGVLLWDRSYARAEFAALADALTTGAMLMTKPDLEKLCVDHSDLVVAASKGSEIWGSDRFCAWKMG